jgi:lysophospholipase L1-like esterase
MPRRWSAWVLIGGLAATVLWLAVAYIENRRVAFHVGLVLLLALLAFSHRWVRLPFVAIQVVNTAILLIVGLPVLNLVLAPSDQGTEVPPLSARPYSYEFARRDPAAFARWWTHKNKQAAGLLRSILVSNADGSLGLRPNTVAPLFESQIRINSQGFRGAELPPKGDAYRIVALGESTTFGLTMGMHDQPWPALLAQLIRDRLHASRPVQVINAGIPGTTLKANLVRLQSDLLPLKPDMIISYHGYNGFAFIFGRMPVIRGAPPPAYHPRPLRILADLEHQIAMRRYRRRLEAPAGPEPAFPTSPMQTEYARLYRELMHVAREHGILLVLATYSMAVNDRSPPDVVDFYSSMHLQVALQIRANAVHTAIVRELAREEPSLVLVDTQPALDGRWEHYFDVVHLTESGERLMAETFYTAIAPTLRTALGGEDRGDRAISGRPDDVADD